jgi:hypothetical protein
MRDIDLFQQALGLQSPWHVTGCTFEQRRLELRIDFDKGRAVFVPRVRRRRLPGA